MTMATDSATYVHVHVHVFTVADVTGRCCQCPEMQVLSDDNVTCVHQDECTCEDDHEVRVILWLLVNIAVCSTLYMYMYIRS